MLASKIKATALAAVLALGAGTVQASTITFEGLTSGYVGDSDTFIQNGLYVTGYSIAARAQIGDRIGAIVDGSNLSFCSPLACPTNNATTFYAGLNDGVLQFDPLSVGSSIHVYGVDASFIGAVVGANYPINSGMLQIQGFFADGSSTYNRFFLGGPVDGSFNFQNFTTSAAFAANAFASVAIFGYSCNSVGSCTAFRDNTAQFAIDNINITVDGTNGAAVPEPGTWAMLGLGLAMMTASRRKKSA